MAFHWSFVLLATAASLLAGVALAWYLGVRNTAGARVAAILMLPLIAVPFLVVAAMQFRALLPAAAVVIGLPFVTLIPARRFRDLDRAYGNAARSHGASEWRIFWRVLLPLAWPSVAVAAALAFARIAAEAGVAARL
jgi:ABC-type molybdate transport system permease subunit